MLLSKAKRVCSLLILSIVFIFSVSSVKSEAKIMWVKKCTTIKTVNKKSKFVVPQWRKVQVSPEKDVVEGTSDVKKPSKPKNTVRIKRGKKVGYISKKKLTTKKPRYTTKNIPYNTFKSYMSYRCITSTGSPQYRLQRRARTDDTTGVRMVGGRYCIAVGPKVATKIGTKLELVFKSGKTVPAIVADQKAKTIDGYRHPDLSAVEFVVDMTELPSCAKRMGDMSALKLFRGRISKIKVFKGEK